MNETTYKAAMTELQEIVDKLENESVEIDEMSDMVKRASELVNICKNKLRHTEQNLDDALKP